MRHFQIDLFSFIDTFSVDQSFRVTLKLEPTAMGSYFHGLRRCSSYRSLTVFEIYPGRWKTNTATIMTLKHGQRLMRSTIDHAIAELSPALSLSLSLCVCVCVCVWWWREIEFFLNANGASMHGFIVLKYVKYKYQKERKKASSFNPPIHPSEWH